MCVYHLCWKEFVILKKRSFNTCTLYIEGWVQQDYRHLWISLGLSTLLHLSLDIEILIHLFVHIPCLLRDKNKIIFTNNLSVLYTSRGYCKNHASPYEFHMEMRSFRTNSRRVCTLNNKTYLWCLMLKLYLKRLNIEDYTYS